MKKFFLTTIVLGIFAVSCGTKESSMSTSSTDSTAAGKIQSTPAVTDTVATPTANPDSIKVTTDTVSASPATK